MNPNYRYSSHFSAQEDLDSDDDSDAESCGCAHDDKEHDGNDENDHGGKVGNEEEEAKSKTKRKIYYDSDADIYRIIEFEVDSDEDPTPQKLEDLPEGAIKGTTKPSDASATLTSKDDLKALQKSALPLKTNGKTVKEEDRPLPIFSDEMYLIASPVVYGFIFNEKTWVEMTVEGIEDITWNGGAFESLMIEPASKKIIQVCF
jgi:hypothetical protein